MQLNLFLGGDVPRIVGLKQFLDPLASILAEPQRKYWTSHFCGQTMPVSGDCFPEDVRFCT